jgi:hypothetical protein
VADELVEAVRDLVAVLHSERAERVRLAAIVEELKTTVSRFVVVAERQLSSGQAVQRRAERVLAGYDPEEVRRMNEQIARKLNKK